MAVENGKDDLISREALMGLARNHVGHVIDCNDIARFPAVDAVPVVHGRWIAVTVPKKYGSIVIRCNECDTKGTRLWNYCPHCGAKMDGEA